MRRFTSNELERCRSQTPVGSPRGAMYGWFMVRRPDGIILRCMASDGDDWEKCGLPLPVWEHVSISVANRCPTWEEMSYVKDLFWLPAECVLQFHPPKSLYVNHHPFTLHLWKQKDFNHPTPPKECIA